MNARIAAGLFVVALSAPAFGGILHVNDDATGTGDGSSWANAFPSLGDAIAAAQPGDEIWVAVGAYRPGPVGQPQLSFALKSGVAIYGGFAGDETSLVARAGLFDQTVLSGDLARDDQPGFVNYGENSVHVVIANGVDASASLDGFTIRAGSADLLEGAIAGGGGLRIENASPRIRRCTFRANLAFNTSSSLSTSVAGGGALLNGGTPLFDQCRFIGNRALGNSNSVGGGGIAVFAGAPQITNCELAGNTVAGPVALGGGVYSVPPLVLVCCTLASNSVGGTGLFTGGGVFATQALGLYDTILWGNLNSGTGGQSAQFGLGGGASIDISHCCIEGWTGAIPAVNTHGLDPQFADPIGFDHRLLVGSPCVDAGAVAFVPPDAADLDGDGDTLEPLPFDVLGLERVFDAPATPDLGDGEEFAPRVDIGAYESHEDAWLYGGQDAGTGGIAPSLAIAGGLPAVDNPSFGIQVVAGRGAAQGVLFIAQGETALSTAAGLLVVDLAGPFVALPFTLAGAPGSAGAGTATLPTPLPPLHALAGALLFAQAAIVDPASSGGVALTPGLNVLVGP